MGSQTDKQALKSESGYSIAELITVTAIVGVLSTVGLASYRGQQIKAQSAEAKHSLVSLYAFQQEYKAAWGTYHGNLVLIGAAPVGPKMYDVGFTDDSKGDGNTFPVPEGIKGNHYAQVLERSTYSEICAGSCKNAAVKADPGSLLKDSNFNCSVDSGGHLLKDNDHSGGAKATYKASTTAFKAAALGELDSVDEWAIDESQILTRVKNGEN